MTYVVEPVPDSLILDCDFKVSATQAKAFVACGFRGFIRYIGFEGPASEDIDSVELDGLLASGGGVMLVQHVRFEGWTPTSIMGANDGMVAVNLARACGYLPGATIWDDLEGIHGTSEQTIDYANSKWQALQAPGYVQGEYIGDDVPLTSAQLYSALKSPIFWRSFSNVPDVATRSYAMRQLCGAKILGSEVDINYATADKLGGRPRWMRAT